MNCTDCFRFLIICISILFTLGLPVKVIPQTRVRTKFDIYVFFMITLFAGYMSVLAFCSHVESTSMIASCH